MENVLRLDDLDSESDGWILEASLAETARYNLNVIKNLGKCYQVDDDPNINIQTIPAEREVPSLLVQTAVEKPWNAEGPGGHKQDHSRLYQHQQVQGQIRSDQIKS